MKHPATISPFTALQKFKGSPRGIPRGPKPILNAQPSSAFGVFVSRQNGRKVGVDVVRPRLALPPETSFGGDVWNHPHLAPRSHGLKMTGNLHHGLEKFIY